MIRRQITLLFAVFAMFCVSAQMPTGDWKIYTGYGNNVTQVIETPSMVYFVSDGNLFHYSKVDEETFAYTLRNSLNGYSVKKIYYNKIKDFLVVSYSDGNIDVLLENGRRVINLPEIKNATSVVNKDVNDVAFVDGRFFVATGFGLVIYDDTKFEVIQSGVYNIDIKSVAIVGDMVLISYPYRLYFAPATSSFITFKPFKLMRANYYSEIHAINDTYAVLRSGNELLLAGFNFASNTVDLKNVGISNSSITFSPMAECVMAYTPRQLATFSTDATYKISSLPEALQSNAMGMNSDVLWVANSEGVGRLKYADGIFSDVSERIKPLQATAVTSVLSMTASPSGRIYFNNIGNSNFFTTGTNVRTSICRIDNGEITDITPSGLTITNPNCKSDIYKEHLIDAWSVVESPMDENTYYICTWWEGVYKIKNGEQVAKYDWTNSPISMVENWACTIRRAQFDRHNNLWLINYVDKGKPAVMMLPASKLNLAETTTSDWKTANMPDFNGGKEGIIHVCGQSDYVLLADAQWRGSFYCYDTRGTLDNFSDDRYLQWSSFTDQDSKSFSPEYIHCITEDKNGKIWLGTDLGVIELPNQSAIYDQNMRINRIKVPRNDGTNYADYLLDGETVYCIAVDSSNRKWLGTKSAGVYLVSEDGSEILEHFTMENSYLPSNKIGAIVCDPKSNSVFIGTEYGLVEYSGTSSPAYDNYENIYAYPNPVTPDYTGLITIKGLMNNSLVKIADSAGNVFYTTRSEGGMATWDGCNSNGQRVKSGVYFVLASQNANETSTGVVTKILIIN